MNTKSLLGGNEMLNKLKNLVIEEEGQALTEYGLIIALVAVAAIGALTALGGKLDSFFNAVRAKIINP